MGAVHGGGMVAGAGAGAGAGAVAGAGAARGQVDHMIEWEGCRPCKLPAGEYKQSFVKDHDRVHAKQEAKARVERDLEAQRQAELAEANKDAKNWAKKMNKRAKKY